MQPYGPAPVQPDLTGCITVQYIRVGTAVTAVAGQSPALSLNIEQPHTLNKLHCVACLKEMAAQVPKS